MKTLIVVDMQNDFVTGALGTKESMAIIPKVKKKIDEYKTRGDEIIFTRDTHSKEYLDTNEGRHLPVLHCVEGPEGWNVISEIDIPEYEHIDKPTFGYGGWEVFDYRTGYSERNFDEIEIIGVCTDICVISNALILKCLYPEISITIDASCCAGVTPEKHKAALEVMKSCQINVIGE